MYEDSSFRVRAGARFDTKHSDIRAISRRLTIKLIQNHLKPPYIEFSRKLRMEIFNKLNHFIEWVCYFRLFFQRLPPKQVEESVGREDFDFGKVNVKVSLLYRNQMSEGNVDVGKTMAKTWTHWTETTTSTRPCRHAIKGHKVEQLYSQSNIVHS